MLQKTLCARKKAKKNEFFAKILLGDLDYIKKTFYSLFGSSGFKTFKSSRTYREVKMLEEDISHDIFEAIHLKFINGSLDDIKYPRSYIKKMIFNKCIDENKRLQRYVSIHSLRNDYNF